MFNPIDNGNVNLSDRIADQIKTKIMTGKLKPGDKLPSENELCHMFNVSRTPIREAVKMLSSQGFVKIKRGLGIYVEEVHTTNFTTHFSPIHIYQDDDFKDLMRIRKLLEINASIWACENAAEKDIREMENIVNESETLLKSDSLAYEELDAMNTFFHILVAKSSGSKVLLQIMHPLWRLISESRKITLIIPERKEKSVEGHREILDAIKKRNAAEAEDAMRRHLEGVSLSVGALNSDL